MQTLKVRSMILGEGREKLICPITAPSFEQAIDRAGKIACSRADAAEYRADLSEDAMNAEVLISNTCLLREKLGGKSLLFTYRTEGQAAPRLEYEYIYTLCESVIALGAADMIDIELSSPYAEKLAQKAKAAGIISVISQHNFSALPHEDEVRAFVAAARSIGGNIVKYAYKISSKAELLRFLSVTNELTESEGAGLICAVPLGEECAFGRLICGQFGSCMSFCALNGDKSAPGQADIELAASVAAALGSANNT